MDEQGRVYIFYTLSEIQEDISCGHEKAVKLLAELDTGHKGIGLIERIKQGQGRPTRIYVKRFTTRAIPPKPVATQQIPRLPKNRSPDFRISEVQTSEIRTQVIFNPIKLILVSLIHLSIHHLPRRSD